MKALEFCMQKNDKLGKYDLKYNNISEQGKWMLSVAVTVTDFSFAL